MHQASEDPSTFVVAGIFLSGCESVREMNISRAFQKEIERAHGGRSFLLHHQANWMDHRGGYP